MEGDLPAVLGTLRQRIEPALTASGIALDWQVQPVPPVAGLEAQGVMHLYRCLQEVFANVVKHAHASRMGVQTWVQDGRVGLSVSDNRVGLGELDVHPSHGGRGMGNIRLRARKLGAEVRFSATEQGTWVTFLLPVEQPVAGDLQPEAPGIQAPAA
jgi:signal transduction histidine kinase